MAKGRPISQFRCARLPGALLAVSVLGCSDGLGPAQVPAHCSNPLDGAGASRAAHSNALFVLQEAPVFSEEQERRLRLVRSRPTSARVHVAMLVQGARSLLAGGGEVTLFVSPGRGFTATRTRVDTTAPDWISWSGRLAGEHGSVQMVLGGSGVTGSLNSVQEGPTSAQYKFEPIGGGMQAIVCVDATKYGLD